MIHFLILLATASPSVHHGRRRSVRVRYHAPAAPPAPSSSLPSFYPASPQQTAGRRLGGSIHVSLAPCTICSHTMSSADKASSKKGLWGKACSVIKIVRTIHHNTCNIISSISFVVMSLMIKKSYEEFIF